MIQWLHEETRISARRLDDGVVRLGFTLSRRTPSNEFASDSSFYGLRLKSNAASIAVFKSINRDQGIAKTLKSSTRTPPILDLRMPEVRKGE